MTETQQDATPIEEENKVAPIIPIPDKQFLCIEYPGYVRRLNKVIETLGGERALSEALSNNLQITLKYRPNDPFSHAINSDTLSCAKLLVKVTRRVKRDKETGEVAKEDKEGYRLEVVGKVFKTVRFRAMADFQYLVPKTDKIRQLREALARGNVNQILEYEAAMDDNDMDNLRIIPPPYFSALEMPFSYGYRQSARVIRVRVKQPDGTYKVKLIHRSRKQDQKLTTVQYDEETVPTRPFYNMPELTSAEDIELSRRTKELFERRPIWSLFALRCELQTDTKISRIVAYHAYKITNGPWRDCWIKFGLDPRTDPKYHIYQILDIRRWLPQNVEHSKRTLSLRKNVATITSLQTPDSISKQVETKEATIQLPGKEDCIFTGTKKPTITNFYFQVCDVKDPEFVPFINNPLYLRSEATKEAGFYYLCVLTRFRRCLRKKYLQLLEKGHVEALGNVTDGLISKIKQEEERSPAGTSQQSATANMTEVQHPSIKREPEDSESINSDTVEEAARQALAAMRRTVYGHEPTDSAANESTASTPKDTTAASSSSINTSNITNKRLKDVVDDYMTDLEKISQFGGDDGEDEDEGEVTVVDEVGEDDDDDNELGMRGFDEDMLGDVEEEDD